MYENSHKNQFSFMELDFTEDFEYLKSRLIQINCLVKNLIVGENFWNAKQLEKSFLEILP